MKKQLLAIALVVVVNVTHAQIGVVPLKEYADFKKRTLIVVVEEPLPDLLSKLSPEQQEVYKQEIDEYNTLVKSAMETYYKVGNPVEYKPRNEVQQIIKKRDRNYAYLQNLKFAEFYKSKFWFEEVQKNRFAKEQTRLRGALTLSAILSRLDIKLAEQDPDNPPFYGQYFPDPFPDKADMVFVFKQIANMFNDRENGITYDKAEKQIQEDAKKLKTATLLIDENEIAADEDRQKLLNAYKYKVEIVSKEKIREAIVSEDPEYVCVVTVPVQDRNTEKTKFQFQAYDCASGKIFAVSLPQDKAGVETSTISAIKSIKKAATESKIPPIRKENLSDFSQAAR
jgi:hypothetical protein